jgi:hypothetical protein
MSLQLPLATHSPLVQTEVQAVQLPQLTVLEFPQLSEAVNEPQDMESLEQKVVFVSQQAEPDHVFPVLQA